MNLPNKLTIARMILVPFQVAFLLNSPGRPFLTFLSLLVFVGACVTDWLDGYLARKNNLITAFGKFMDPLADKVLVSSALICMVSLGRLSAWIVIIIIAREFIISGFRLIAAEKGVVIAANYWGKAKTVAQMVMTILLIVNFPGKFFGFLTSFSVWLSVLLTLLSLGTYIFQNMYIIMSAEES